MPFHLQNLLPHNEAVDDLVFAGWQGAIFIAAIVVGWLAHALIFRVLNRMKTYSRMSFLPYMLPHTRRPLFWFLIACSLTIALTFMALPKVWETRAQLTLDAIGIISFGWMLMGVTLATAEWLGERYPDDQRDTLHFRSVNTRLRVFTHVIVFVVWLFTGITVIMTVPHLRSIGVSLFASAGVAGIVIGMAAGPTLSNLIAGIQLALTQPIRIGDQITLGNVAGIVGSVSGVVEEIDSTYVVVQLWDQRRLIVPLNYFIQNQFQNWTHSLDTSPIAMVPLFLDYAWAVEPVRQELQRIVKTLPLWDGKVCALDVIDLTSGKMVELRASASTGSAGDVFLLQCQIREALLSFVQHYYVASVKQVV